MNKSELKGYLLACCDQIDEMQQNGELEDSDLAIKIAENLRLYLKTDDIQSFLEEIVLGSFEYNLGNFPERMLSNLELYLSQTTSPEIVHYYHTSNTDYDDLPRRKPILKYYIDSTGTSTTPFEKYVCDWMSFYEGE